METHVNLGSFGVTGVKMSFSLKMQKFTCVMLHSMTIGLIHVDQLETSPDIMGSHVNLGSFGVTWVKRSLSLKML